MKNEAKQIQYAQGNSRRTGQPKKEHKIKMREYQSFLTKIIITIFLLLLQIAFLTALLINFSKYLVYVQGFLMLITFFVVLWILNKQDNPAYKLAWIIPILMFPIIGGPLYLFLAGNRTRNRFSRTITEINEKTDKKYLPQNEAVMRQLKKADNSAGQQATYISNYGQFPVYANTDTMYFEDGQPYYQQLLKDLKSAKDFIFLEYFIIKTGVFWNDVLQILLDKAKEGLDVRLIFDDIGCVTTIPPKFVDIMNNCGIQCVSFNPFIPTFNLRQNNRDHRKIVVIDGNIGYTGGINLADEYIHIKKPFGYWKDTGIRLEGDAVWNFTVMFLQMWEYLKKETPNYDRYRPTVKKGSFDMSNGFVQPYSDAPVDHELVGANIYLNILHHAKRYVYMTTPYLIIDNETATALCLAAKNGLDVRIITPGIPDKKMVYILTQSNYRQLIEAGVKIYSFTPGFIHSKTFVCDDEIATVGTVNMDFRSLYLHFECGVWMYQTSAVPSVKKDFMETLSQSHEVALNECLKMTGIKGLFYSVLKILSPLL